MDLQAVYKSFSKIVIKFQKKMCAFNVIQDITLMKIVVKKFQTTYKIAFITQELRSALNVNRDIF